VAALQLDRCQTFRAPREASVCRPGRTLIGVVAQTVGATVGAAHALCLRGVEVALADHPGGLVAGELQRGGGGQELHQRGGSRSLEERDVIVLARVWRAFPCRNALRQGAAPRLEPRPFCKASSPTSLDPVGFPLQITHFVGQARRFPFARFHRVSTDPIVTARSGAARRRDGPERQPLRASGSSRLGESRDALGM
jgi:hypothetical protein